MAISIHATQRSRIVGQLAFSSGCRLSARNRPGAMSALGPVSGLEQKLDFGALNARLSAQPGNQARRILVANGIEIAGRQSQLL